MFRSLKLKHQPTKEIGKKRKNGNENMKCVQTEVMTTVKSNSEKLIDLSAVSIEKIDFHLRDHFQFKLKNHNKMQK